MIKNKILIAMLMLIILSCGKEDVEPDKVFIESISLSAEDLTDGFLRQIEVVVSPANATSKKLIWSSSDTDIARVSENGFVTALKNGNVTITATAADRETISAQLSLNISSFGQNNGEIIEEVNTVAKILLALGSAQAGDTILIEGGTYNMNENISLNESGTADNPIVIMVDLDNRPVLNFSAFEENSSNRAIRLSGDYWHIIGIDVINAGDNGLNISGSNNIIEFCTFSGCADTGLQLGGGASNNLILNCDSYHNADSTIENADGFACKLDAESGNKFIGCRAWENLDDGWDGYLRTTDNINTYHENCWAIRNGYLKTGEAGRGDGNGFKTGGSDNKELKHNAFYTNCIAVGNIFDGFDHNSNRGDVSIINCGAFDNGRNFSFSTSNIVGKLTIKNSATIGNPGQLRATTPDLQNNSWDEQFETNEEDFISLDYSQLLAPRKIDGSLPDVDFMTLSPGSDLIDAGIDVGAAFNGSAPDIGPFESN